MTDAKDVHSLNAKELLLEITLIEENMAECGQRSSYAHRNGPRLKELKGEVSRRAKEYRQKYGLLP